MITIKNIVKKEKEFLPKNNSGNLFMQLWGVITLIIIVIGFDFSDVSYGHPSNNIVQFGIINQLIVILISSVFSIGISQLSYSIVREKGEKFSIAFQVFTNTKIFKRMFTMILSYIIVCIGLILLIIPGIILSYAFALVPFVLIDEDYQSLSITETLKKSWELMKNNKMKLFHLQLKYFLPFILLIIGISIIAGILFLIYSIGLGTATAGAVIVPWGGVLFMILSQYYSKYCIALAIFYKQIKEDKTVQPIEEV